jgi:Protein of unknown function (DUF992)
MRKLALAGAAALSLLAMPAMTREGMELGVLDCSIQGGTGFIVGSTKNLNCIFRPSAKNLAAERYVGQVHKIGLDVGVTGRSVMRWLVLAPNSNIYARGSLAGNYVGASAEATAGVGVGANLLVGGSNRGFTLQPVSVQTQTGLNLAAGVTRFELRKPHPVG